MLEKTLTLKDFEEKYLRTFHDFADEYQPINLWKKYSSLSSENQKNPDVLKELKQLDINVNVNWPLVHYRTAVHYLSKGTGEEKGTGGTNWQKYLPPRFQRDFLFHYVLGKQDSQERV